MPETIEEKLADFERRKIRCLGNFAPGIASQSFEGRRVETGALKIGNDWPGVFIRGDEAFALAQILEYVASLAMVKECAEPEERNALASLISLLRSCRVPTRDA